MSEKNIILMRGRFSNFSDFVKLIRGLAGQFIENDRFMIASYVKTDIAAGDIFVDDIFCYKFNSNGTVTNLTEENNQGSMSLREAAEVCNNPGLIIILDFYDNYSETTMNYIDTVLGLKYVTIIYYDKKNRPLILREPSKNIRLLNRFLKVEEMNRIHRRSCIIMKKESQGA